MSQSRGHWHMIVMSIIALHSAQSVAGSSLRKIREKYATRSREKRLRHTISADFWWIYLWCFGPWQSDRSITMRSAVLSRDHNVFNTNSLEFPVEFILQLLGGCLELQVSHIKGNCSPLPSLVEVDCIRHLVKSSCKFFLCFILNFLGCFWEYESSLHMTSWPWIQVLLWLLWVDMSRNTIMAIILIMTIDIIAIMHFMFRICQYSK